MIRKTSLCAAAALCLASCQVASPAADRRTAGDSGSVADSASVAEDRPVAAQPDTTARLTPQGWGPLRIGMTRAEVVAAAGEDAHPEAVGGPEPEVCDEFRPARAPEGMIVMVERLRLTRISLGAGSEVRTERGLGVGDPAAAVRAAHGAEAVSSPHKYSPAPAEYVTVWSTAPSGPDARGIVYETGTDGRVARVHAGGPSIQYVEGCL